MKHETMHTTTDKAYLTTTEAADYVRLSSRTLERFCVEGTGPTYAKAGRRSGCRSAS